MKNYNELFKKENDGKYYLLINTNMVFLLNPYENLVFQEIAHLGNIENEKTKVSVRTISRFTNLSDKVVQKSIKKLRDIGILFESGYNLNLDLINEIYSSLNSFKKLADKKEYCEQIINNINVEKKEEKSEKKVEEISNIDTEIFEETARTETGQSDYSDYTNDYDGYVKQALDEMEKYEDFESRKYVYELYINILSSKKSQISEERFNRYEYMMYNCMCRKKFEEKFA